MRYFAIIFVFLISACSETNMNTLPSNKEIATAVAEPQNHTSTTLVTSSINESIKPGWKLMFQDEFDASELSTIRWNKIDFGYKDHGRLQHYLPEQISIDSGILSLNVNKTSYQTYPYRSGAVTTEGKHDQLYGKFEVRARFPIGQGLLPAIWLLPSNGDAFPEIDIVEMLGQLPNELWHVAHLGDGQRDFKLTTNINGSEWHIYTLDWLEDELIFYVDGKEQFRTPNISKTSMYLWLNVAVGGTWVGDPDQTTEFPTSMEVDYVRIYSKL